MDARQTALKRLKSLNYDFRTFSIENFIGCIEDLLGRKIKTFPWEMGPYIFGAWISDSKNQTEYIFYRDDVPAIHQIHIQLHELAHLLLGHPTLDISQVSLEQVLINRDSYPLESVQLLRSDRVSRKEEEAEILASLIQEQVIRHSNLVRLTQGGSSYENLADFMNNLGMNG